MTYKGADAETVLTDLLTGTDPVVIMGNTVDEFMREFEEVVRTQEQAASDEHVTEEFTWIGDSDLID